MKKTTALLIIISLVALFGASSPHATADGATTTITTITTIVTSTSSLLSSYATTSTAFVNLTSSQATTATSPLTTVSTALGTFTFQVSTTLLVMVVQRNDTVSVSVLGSTTSTTSSTTTISTTITSTMMNGNISVQLNQIQADISCVKNQWNGCGIPLSDVVSQQAATANGNFNGVKDYFPVFSLVMASLATVFAMFAAFRRFPRPYPPSGYGQQRAFQVATATPQGAVITAVRPETPSYPQGGPPKK